jgi:hypothetical protein
MSCQKSSWQPPFGNFQTSGNKACAAQKWKLPNKLPRPNLNKNINYLYSYLNWVLATYLATSIFGPRTPYFRSFGSCQKVVAKSSFGNSFGNLSGNLSGSLSAEPFRCPAAEVGAQSQPGLSIFGPIPEAICRSLLPKPARIVDRKDAIFYAALCKMVALSRTQTHATFSHTSQYLISRFHGFSC